MSYPKLRAAAQTGILAVIENLPVDANGFFLTDEQMSNVEAALTAGEVATAALETANASLATATAETARLTAELATANTALATAQAEVTRLENLPGSASRTSTDQDPVREAVVDPMAFDFQQDILKRVND